MAQVFLSYDREDGPKARVIAQALERAGHFVWFDLHIKGGAEYGREIERALEQSDAVVVLWSERSVVSAWVRDEAAAGRDKGCLIPVLIEPVSPPMGFRQYQNLDFSGWKGRGKPPRLAELLDSIGALGEPSPLGRAAAARPPPPPVTAHAPRARNPLIKWALIGGAVMLVLVSIGLFTGLVLNNNGKSDEINTVSVAAADAAARPLARDLLVKLSTLQGAKSGSMRLLGQSPEADFTFEMASNQDRTRLGANLVLLGGKDREILWSKDFEQPSGKLADLKQQMAVTAARVLGCALDGASYDGRSLEPQVLKLYLNACALLAEQGEPQALIQAFSEVTEKAPRFAPAWQGLLIAKADAADIANAGGVFDPASLEALRRTIEAAEKLHPQLPEIKLARITLLPATAYQEGMRLLDEAKEESPNNPIVLNWRANGLRSVGRALESIEDAEHALIVDPLSPAMLNGYISALAYSGRIEAAREQLAKAERLWPGTAALQDIQFRFHLRYGDPKEALRLGHLIGMPPMPELFLKARVDPTSANIDAVKESAMKATGDNAGILAGTAQALGHFNLNDELYQLVLSWRDPDGLAELQDVWFRPSLAGFRRDPRFMRVMKRIGLVEYWRKSGKWPDFCADPDLPYDCKAEAAKLASAN